MNKAPNLCPFCHGNMEISRLHCPSCDTTLEGHFEATPFSQLNLEQMNFMITFIRNEGKINRVGEELGISYPTVRGRLHDLIRALGFEVGEEEESVPDDERRSVLDSLSKGQLTSEEALKRLSRRG